MVVPELLCDFAKLCPLVLPQEATLPLVLEVLEVVVLRSSAVAWLGLYVH